MDGQFTVNGLTASLPVKTNSSKALTAAAIDVSGSEITGTLATANVPGFTGGDVTNSAGSLVLTVGDNSVDGTDIAVGSDAQGDVLYYDGTNWVRLGAGTTGQKFETRGAGANPVWDTDETGAGGGGSSSLAITTGTSGGFTGPVISSPTAIILFDQNTFLGQLSAGSTYFSRLNSSSVTLQGNTFNGVSQLLQTGSDGFIEDADVDGSSITKVGPTIEASEITDYTTSISIFPYEAKLTGAYVTSTPSGLDASAASAVIDGGNGAWSILFDPTTDEATVWPIVLPQTWVSHGTLQIAYSLASATTLEVEWEAAVMCVTPGDAADIDTASFAAGASAGPNTVPATAGHIDLSTATITDDSCAAGDIMYLYVSCDSNDATNDDATGDRELRWVEYRYTASQ